MRQSEELKKRLSTISISNNNDSGVPTPPSTSQQLIKFYNEKDKEEKERIAREENEKERLRQMEAAIEKEKERVKSTEKEKDKEQGKEKEREKYNSNLSKILTSKNSDITPQERVSQTVQTLLGNLYYLFTYLFICFICLLTLIIRGLQRDRRNHSKFKCQHGFDSRNYNEKKSGYFNFTSFQKYCTIM